MNSKILRNIVGNWLGIGADAVVGLVLTRIILHSVGAASFGLWVLLSGLLGYYGLLDLGTRNAIIRFVARFDAQKDHDNLSKVVSTALATYMAVGLAALLLAVVAAWRLDDIITVDRASDLVDGRRLVLILGVGAAIAFPLNAFGGALEGLQQFVLIGTVQAATSILRALVVVAFLYNGYGIVTVGLITVLFNVAGGLVNVAFVLRRLPHIQFRFANIQRETLSTLAGFGLVTFWVGVSNRLRFESDALVIGNVLGLQMVAVFAIGSKILSYGTEAVAAMASVFTPILSNADALGDRDLVKQMTFTGNYYSSLLAFPIILVLLFFGKLLINIWVGPLYLLSYTVIAIIGVPMALYMSQGGSLRMLYGIGRHKPLAKVLFCEGLANIVLSVILARRFGVIGVAWGTAIPLAITALLVLPIMVGRELNISFVTYWRSAQVPALVMIAPMLLLFGIFAAVNREPTIVEGMFELALGGALYGFMTIADLRKSRREIAR